ncbi:MAG: hypothetical protein HYY34_03265 [Chloroflexi bacterium]|nr:hypothetical protein [Chloroflexota bacterium]
MRSRAITPVDSRPPIGRTPAIGALEIEDFRHDDPRMIMVTRPRIKPPVARFQLVTAGLSHWDPKVVRREMGKAAMRRMIGREHYEAERYQTKD